MRLPFDAHNHVHLGPSQALGSLLSGGSLDGIGLMSTHPRDFDQVRHLALHNNNRNDDNNDESSSSIHIVPGFGVHPWLLHEPYKGKRFWENNDIWLNDLKQHLDMTPDAIVGEIGLDGFRFLPETGELPTPMDVQLQVFEAQMRLASQLQRPVSIHAVHCWGPLLQSLAKLRQSNELPPSLYFHAFGGKVGTVNQLLATCRDDDNDSSSSSSRRGAYFGFAPCINFRAPKTASVVRHVGLDRLLLETDREDASYVSDDIAQGITFLAQALNQDEHVIVQQTTQNAHDFYRLSSSSSS